MILQNMNSEIIGDISSRHKLGSTFSVEMYRIMKLTFENFLSVELGENKKNHIFFTAGNIAGHEIYNNFLNNIENFDYFLIRMINIFKDFKIGILDIENIDPKKNKLIVSIRECITCCGSITLGYPVCHFESGFLSGIFNSYFKKRINIEETECWCTGSEKCKFIITLT